MGHPMDARSNGETGSTVNLAATNQSSSMNSRLVVVLLAVCAVVAAVALVIGLVALSRPPATTVNIQGAGSPTSSSADAQSGNMGDRVWMIGVGHDYGAFEYIDNKGYIKGFSYDLIREVCEAAGIDCRIVWDKYTNCWKSTAGEHSMGGQGLMGRWYDACMSWYPTIGRQHVFTFSKSFVQAPMANFYVKQSDNSFNPNDISGKKIVFMDGWAYDEKCVARQDSITGSYLDMANIVHVTTVQQFADAIINGDVDAGFTGENSMITYVKGNTLKKAGSDVMCMLGGNALMTRKDTNLAALWDKGFDKIVENGKYNDICVDKVAQDHSAQGEIKCLDV